MSSRRAPFYACRNPNIRMYILGCKVTDWGKFPEKTAKSSFTEIQQINRSHLFLYGKIGLTIFYTLLKIGTELDLRMLQQIGKRALGFIDK